MTQKQLLLVNKLMKNRTDCSGVNFEMRNGVIDIHRYTLSFWDKGNNIIKSRYINSNDINEIIKELTK